MGDLVARATDRQGNLSVFPSRKLQFLRGFGVSQFLRRRRTEITGGRRNVFQIVLLQEQINWMLEALVVQRVDDLRGCPEGLWPIGPNRKDTAC